MDLADYVEWRGDLPFSKSGFCDVDSLILCQLSYLNFDGLIPSEFGRKISLADLHYYEEPCISGKNGSGAIFFTGCNMNCKFCQNYEISQLCKGKIVTIEELADEFLKLQNKGANNINLVTGCIYVPQIIEALKIAKNNGLSIPVVYNSSGYEKKETIKMLDGYVDVYLPDLKYYYDDLAKNLSGINKYFEIVLNVLWYYS